MVDICSKLQRPKLAAERIGQSTTDKNKISPVVPSITQVTPNHWTVEGGVRQSTRGTDPHLLVSRSHIPNDVRSWYSVTSSYFTKGTRRRSGEVRC